MVFRHRPCDRDSRTSGLDRTSEPRTNRTGAPCEFRLSLPACGTIYLPGALAVTSRRARSSIHSLRPQAGFTILEMLIVMVLLGGVLVLVVPRIVVGEDLSSAGRKLIGTLRALQQLAETGQKPVKLYLDLDRGTYWAAVVDGKEETRPFGAAWAAPLSLPAAIRVTEVSVRQATRTYGIANLSFFPNGRIDPAVIHLTDASGNLLILAVDALTGHIRTFDRRPDSKTIKPIPDRIRALLQASARK